MSLSLVVVMVGCVCAMAFMPSTVSAASESIVFSGAVVEPTCSISTAQSSLVATTASGTQGEAQRWACVKPGHASVGASPMYALTAERLSSSVSDRVLKYFDTYVKASRLHAADPVLLTQTYP